MKKELSYILLSLLLLLLPRVPVHGQEGRSLLLYFRFDRTTVDSGYMENMQSLGAFRALFTDSVSVSLIDSVVINAFSSPDGNEAYNRNLALKRSQAVKGYLVWKFPLLDQHRISIYSHGENWMGLRELVMADTSVPCRDEVLRILDEMPESRRREELLRALDGGSAYRYIEQNFLRYLRNAAVCTVWTHQEKCAMRIGKAMNAHTPLGEEIHKRELMNVNMLRGLENPVETLKSVPMFAHSSAPGSPDRKRPLLALKTNLLFDLALIPNIEVELPLGRYNRWSLNAEWMFPWWLFDHNKYCLQILSGGIEGRYWLGSRQGRFSRTSLTGHFVGLYAGGGKYDLQWDTNGYQGEFYIASGISYGYSTRIARRLNLEFSIGIGLLRTHYEYYHAIDNYHTLLWQNNGNYTWFGPTKAKISLVWLLGRKGGRK